MLLEASITPYVACLPLLLPRFPSDSHLLRSLAVSAALLSLSACRDPLLRTCLLPCSRHSRRLERSIEEPASSTCFSGDTRDS